MLGNAINRCRNIPLLLRMRGRGRVRAARSVGGMFPTRVISMKKTVLFSIFLRSLTIQASFNFYRMQSLGFAFSLLPLTCQEGDREGRSASLTRHLEMFNTHPYLTALVIGSVVRLEEDGDTAAADYLKKAVMGPYAAIGDPFFWGALRSFSSATAVLLALKGVLLAPLALLILHNPTHLWIRAKGFIEGYRRGKGSIDFIRVLSLPGIAGRVRLLSLILIGIISAVAAEMACRSWTFLPEIPLRAVVLALIILCFTGVRRGISPVTILYGMMLLCVALSI
jgi:mannose/fructose/N-acetylgalactosamine-specific phosphotransferase system component IID